MIIKHKLIFSDFNDYKLQFVKILKEYTGEGLKACKFVADLLPSSNYFQKPHINDGETKGTHLRYIHSHSNMLCEVNNNEVILEFDMDSSKTFGMSKRLEEWKITFELRGIQELREEKLKQIFDEC